MALTVHRVYPGGAALEPSRRRRARTRPRLGRHGALDELEDRYAAGEISNAEIATTSAGWFAGRTPQDVAAALERAPWIAGIQETVAALRAAGTYVVLATVTWRFVAAITADRFGFEACCGTETVLPLLS